MGHAIGRALRGHGLDVITCLVGRSERTRTRAADAGMRTLASYEDLVREADLILAILVPDEAVSVARLIADAMRAAGRGPYIADCNAVSPRTASTIGEIVTAAGGKFIDASIIGLPPADGVTPRLYVSGPHAHVLKLLHGKGMEIVTLGGHIGEASGLKMCYAAVTKGTFALYYAAATSAAKLGLFDELCREFEHSQPEVYQVMQRQLPRLPAKAFRWAGEMEQIAETLEMVGVTPSMHRGAAELYRLVSNILLVENPPELTDKDLLAGTIAAIVKSQSR
jgi:3-hydroxyisobutyrate dehydrogenase-like beta-hydroxyacid dehydrogenase